MIHLEHLSILDGESVYKMLKGISTVENSFTNPVYNMDYAEYRRWLSQQADWAQGRNLPKGYVSQSIYWLFDNDIPVGIGKIRHSLTEESRVCGGNIGYAISAEYRGKGYGAILLSLLLKEAKEMNIKEILLTIDKGNIASKRVCEKNKGQLVCENSERWYFKF